MVQIKVYLYIRMVQSKSSLVNCFSRFCFSKKNVLKCIFKAHIQICIVIFLVFQEPLTCRKISSNAACTTHCTCQRHKSFPRLLWLGLSGVLVSQLYFINTPCVSHIFVNNDWWCLKSILFICQIDSGLSPRYDADKRLQWSADEPPCRRGVCLH